MVDSNLFLFIFSDEDLDHDPDPGHKLAIFEI